MVGRSSTILICNGVRIIRMSFIGRVGCGRDSKKRLSKTEFFYKVLYFSEFLCWFVYWIRGQKKKWIRSFNSKSVWWSMIFSWLMKQVSLVKKVKYQVKQHWRCMLTNQRWYEDDINVNNQFWVLWIIKTRPKQGWWFLIS